VNWYRVPVFRSQPQRIGCPSARFLAGAGFHSASDAVQSLLRASIGGIAGPATQEKSLGGQNPIPERLYPVSRRSRQPADTRVAAGWPAVAGSFGLRRERRTVLPLSGVLPDPCHKIRQSKHPSRASFFRDCPSSSTRAEVNHRPQPCQPACPGVPWDWSGHGFPTRYRHSDVCGFLGLEGTGLEGTDEQTTILRTTLRRFGTDPSEGFAKVSWMHRPSVFLCTHGGLLRLRPATLLFFLVTHDPFDLVFVLLC
jgi:hypothetical protein